MKRKHTPIHIHEVKTKHDFSVLLLLVPSIIFVVSLALSLRFFVNKNISSSTNKVEAGENKTTPTEDNRKTIKIGESILDVIVADTEEKRKKGLSGTTQLNDDDGMLFIWDKNNSRPVIWMKDMLIPIDIIWIQDEKIVHIEESVTPPEPGTPDHNLKLYIPNQPANYVLEVANGWVGRYNIDFETKVSLF